MDKTLGQLGCVERLEYILVVDVLEEDHLDTHLAKESSLTEILGTYHLVQGILQIALLCKLVVLSQQRICVLSKQFGRFGR